MLKLEKCLSLRVVISSKQTMSSKSFLVLKLSHKACKYAIWCSSTTTEIEGIFAIIYSLISYLSNEREVTKCTRVSFNKNVSVISAAHILKGEKME